MGHGRGRVKSSDGHIQSDHYDISDFYESFFVRFPLHRHVILLLPQLDLLGRIFPSGIKYSCRIFAVFYPFKMGAVVRKSRNSRTSFNYFNEQRAEDGGTTETICVHRYLFFVLLFR